MRRHNAIYLAVVLTGLSRFAIAQGVSLEEVIVTAQKQMQTLQEVPLSVSVMTGDFITSQNIVDMAGLNERIPNLVVAKSPYQPVITIRGIGTGGGTRAFEQSVATYVDGVYAGKANQFLNPFFDVERLEVVRGPQAVLFGVNAIAGGINIVNKEPAQAFEGFISAGYEFEDQSHRVDGAVSIPLTDTLGVRLSGRKGFEGGWVENVVTGDDEPESDYHLYRGVLKWTPRDDVSVKLSAETSEMKTDGSALQMYAIAAPFAGIPPEDGKFDFKRSSSGLDPEYTDIDADNVTLNIEWDVADHVVSSVTGYSQFDFDQSLLAAPLPIPLGSALAEEAFEQIYQELRLQSPGGELVDYVLGMAYYSQESDIYQGVDIPTPPVPGTAGFGVRNGFEQETKSFAVFAQGTINFTDSFRAVLGLRYSDVKKEVDYVISATTIGSPLDGYGFYPAGAESIVANFPFLGWMEYNLGRDATTVQPGSWSRTKNLESVDPSLSLQWDIGAAWGTYFTYAQGTKAGGFNDQEKMGRVTELGFAVDEFEYEKERANSYEIGAKYSGNRFKFNTAFFYTEFEDLQVSSSSGSNILTRNAAQITTQGVEVDYELLVTDYLKIGGDLAYLDAEYDDFPGVGCINPMDGTPPCSAAQNANTNAKGGDPDMVALKAGSFFVESAFGVGAGLEMTLRARAYYNSGYSLASDQDPIDRQDSYWKYDASVELAAIDGVWSASLQGKNLSNEAVIGFGGDAGLGAGHSGFVQPGRQLFLDVRYNF